jgi:hypothetical protein
MSKVWRRAPSEEYVPKVNWLALLYLRERVRASVDEGGAMSASAWQHSDAREPGAGLTSEQLDLIYSQRDLTIDERFAKFHRENPLIYRKLVNLCREVKGAGHDHYSVKALFERLRWWHHIELKSKEPFLLNNDFTARYSRAIMLFEPDLAGFFEVRKLRAKGSAL